MHNSNLLSKFRFGILLQAFPIWILSRYVARMNASLVDGSWFHRSYLYVGVGVPQGSILGTIRFILYINELDNFVPAADITIIADDISLIIPDKKIR